MLMTGKKFQFLLPNASKLFLFEQTPLKSRGTLNVEYIQQKEWRTLSLTPPPV